MSYLARLVDTGWQKDVPIASWKRLTHGWECWTLPSRRTSKRSDENHDHMRYLTQVSAPFIRFRLQSSNCTFALGAEIQTLDVYSGDTHELASGEYRLQYTATASDDRTDVTTTSE